MMAVSPVARVVAPRFWGGVISMPLLAAMFSAMGICGGWLVGVDRDINKNFRVGVGYNFTDFSDDLTDFDYDHKGWFLNMVGTY